MFTLAGGSPSGLAPERPLPLGLALLYDAAARVVRGAGGTTATALARQRFLEAPARLVVGVLLRFVGGHAASLPQPPSPTCRSSSEARRREGRGPVSKRYLAQRLYLQGALSAIFPVATLSRD